MFKLFRFIRQMNRIKYCERIIIQQPINSGMKNMILPVFFYCNYISYLEMKK